jgi:hypothetical protein
MQILFFILGKEHKRNELPIQIRCSLVLYSSNNDVITLSSPPPLPQEHFVGENEIAAWRGESETAADLSVK